MLLSVIASIIFLSIRCKTAAISATNCSWREDFGGIPRPLGVCMQPTHNTSEVYLCNEAEELIKYSYDSVTDCSGYADTATKVNRDHNCGEPCPYMTWIKCSNASGYVNGAIGPLGVCFEGVWSTSIYDSVIYRCENSALYFEWWDPPSLWAARPGRDCEPADGGGYTKLMEEGCGSSQLGTVSCNGSQLPFITEATIDTTTTSTTTTTTTTTTTPTNVDLTTTTVEQNPVKGGESSIGKYQNTQFLLLILIIIIIFM